MQNTIMEAIKRGDEVVTDKGISFNEKLLGFPLRHVYAVRKRIFMKMLIAFANKKYPDPDTYFCNGSWTDPISRAFDKLILYAKYNTDFWKACKRLVKGEVESDNLYCDPMLMMLESIIEEILDGNFQGRALNMPESKYWNEPKPYGGEHSIINQIRKHRKEINDILGREHKEET